MGLLRGPYSVSVVKEGVGALTGTVTLRAGQSFEMNMELMSPDEVIRESLSEEEVAALERAEATTDAFDRGLAAARGGDLDEAVTLLNSALDTAPGCAECQRNLGIVYTQMEQYAQAETAFKAALALDPDNAASYDGLAEIYNTQRRFDDAMLLNLPDRGPYRPCNPTTLITTRRLLARGQQIGSDRGSRRVSSRR